MEKYEKRGGYNPQCPSLAIVKEDDLGHMFSDSYAYSQDKPTEGNVRYEQISQDPEAVIIRVKEEPSYIRSKRSHPQGIAHVLIHTDYSKSGIPTVHSVLALPKEKAALAKTSSEVYALFDTEDDEAHQYLTQAISSALSAFEMFDRDHWRSPKISNAICSDRIGWSNNLITKSEACSRYVSALIQRKLDTITHRNGGSHLTPVVSAVHGWDNYTWNQALATGEIDSEYLNGPPLCTPDILQDIESRNAVSQGPNFPGIGVQQQYNDPEAPAPPYYEISCDASIGQADTTATSSYATVTLTTKGKGIVENTLDGGFPRSHESISMAQPSSWTDSEVPGGVSSNRHSGLNRSLHGDSNQPERPRSQRTRRILSRMLCGGQEGSESDD